MAYKAKRMEEGSHALRFEIYYGDRHMASTVLNQSVIKVGSLSSSGLRLDWDDRVSRMHAVIEVASKEAISVIDLGSREGTFLNDTKVNKGDVKPGDVLRFGDTLVEVYRADSPREKKEDPLPEEKTSKAERMSLTECLEWAHRNKVLLHFKQDSTIIAWLEDGGNKVKGVTLANTINLVRDYNSL